MDCEDNSVSEKKAKLVLDDGSVFEGVCFGAAKSCTGEVVFNTGMVGYPEALTDPSYRGQILVLTYPLIGNYGVPLKEGGSLLEHFESERIHVSALVISDLSSEPSHWSCARSLNTWLSEEGIPAIRNIATRDLTKRLREKGVMLGKIIVDRDIEIDDPNKRNLVSEVSVKQPLGYKGDGPRIVLVDCGVKHNIIRSLLNLGVHVIRVPWDYDFTFMDYDGVVISNGPGDPKMCRETIRNIGHVMEQGKPILGVCLGNQLLALAAGGDTFKMKYGHRSQNQPCLEAGGSRCYITSQNHGFAVRKESLPDSWQEWFINANDRTNEGIRHKSRPFMSVQFHPEHSPGPTDTSFLFERFISIVKQYRNDYNPRGVVLS
ncbi:carbamoyl-phosphate synthase (glutamine-hydrolyzing) small subunit [Candidatus Woesearchaeota archaeon CG08_land_8_20_14_0_20_47_9]|nr:MAG: carbamoyl phosphate synthase small subunit [Candidatus Woesearchaeota archaeon CG1_02_47_18]PIN72539.1 MAG: carbamoyl phosphate synthase small subunit [Candidatus Woesearchaeota archaeon CG10_big_fil_rev_8_21_14_0_10_47_5]PIO04145.1 MAG: carbamoyl-phosphate synthase (glutamine-hydrolyzing) small subunit [Candidatus Woesearchaeota archaeon CG08_land_8_20_14_0_20_47_9]HII30167.1 glutamine-hydrolyzing carbamoyl-phosphate synthase small subunit [Candidatus Woesearchaeota archaeon]